MTAIGSQKISAQDLVCKLRSGEDLTLLDVRDLEETSGKLGPLPGLVQIPLPQLHKRWGELKPRDRKIVIICGSGKRATIAAWILLTEGFSRVLVLDGGITSLPQRGAVPGVQFSSKDDAAPDSCQANYQC